MPKNNNDRIMDEVRRRMTEIASAAGVDTGRISLEVLFLLPSNFVRQYEWLFSQALGDPVRSSSDGGKDEGRVKASGKPRDDLKARSMGGAKKGGKRYVQQHWPVRDDEALKLKLKLDKKIIIAVEEAVDELRRMRAAKSRGETELYSRHQTHGIRCSECGKFLKADWQRCPYHPHESPSNSDNVDPPSVALGTGV